MDSAVTLIKLIAVLIAAIVLGNWFINTARRAHARGKPLYASYLTLPGILVVAAVLLPILLWILSH
jgi:hypothetical protein